MKKCQRLNCAKMKIAVLTFASLPLLLLLSPNGHAGEVPLPLGIVIGQGMPEVQAAFKHALYTFSMNISTNPRDVYRLTAFVDTINTADAFKLSKLICNQFSRGIYAMAGSMNAESFHTYHAFANTFHMPLVTPWYPTRETAKGDSGTSVDFATRLKPDFDAAILDVVRYYGWKEVIYLYSTNEGLLRLQTLFYRNSQTSGDMLKIKLVKKFNSAKDAIKILTEIESKERYSTKYVLLDCPTDLAKEIIVSHVHDIQLGRRTYHYLLTGLAFDDPWEPEVLEYNAINITSFRIVDPDRRFVKEFMKKWSILDKSQFTGAGKNTIAANAAFMYDGMLIIKEAFNDILTDNPYVFSRFNAESACESGTDFLEDVRPFEYGNTVNQHLRRVQTEGLTGNIQFNENGTRKYFTVDVLELRDNSTKFKIAQWSDYSGFKLELNEQGGDGRKPLNKNAQDVYIVSTILEEPFLQLKPSSQRKTLSGNDIYQGFMKDFADALFQNLGLKYRFQLVHDGKYGSKIVSSYGENWNGIVGELIRKEVDLAIAPLTINVERTRVIEFTKPFLNERISILGYKSKKPQPGMFSFMNPLSEWVWLSILAAYLGVSLVLYFIYRLATATAAERKQEEQQQEMVVQHERSNGGLNVTGGGGGSSQIYLIQKNEERQGKLPVTNFLWLSFSILLNSRPTGLFPRSIAAKMASTIWWLFALILVSLYTGNYIAIRMRNKAGNQVRSPWDLVERDEIQYGTLKSGTTFDFFKNSENQIYQAMYEHMSGPNQLNMPTNEDGINQVRQRKGKYVFLIESIKGDYVNNRKPCNTMKIGFDLAEMHYGIGLPIGSPLTEQLNLEILKLKEESVIQRLEEKWWKNNMECETGGGLKGLDSSPEDQLPLGNVVGIFYVLIVGMVVAVAVSFLEFFCTSKSNSSNCNSSRNDHHEPNCGSGSSRANVNMKEGQRTMMRGNNSHCHSSHHHSYPHYQANTMDTVPLPNEFCDIPSNAK